jgi:hypothetical protein
MRILTAFLFLCLTACTSTEKETSQASETNYSGFLSDYSQLKKVDVGDDSDLLRFIDSKIKEHGYETIILDPVTFYPTPKESDIISNKALASISDYFNATLINIVKESGKLVENAGSKTLRVKMAITSIDVTDSKLSAYQYVPIAFLVTAASGGLSDMDVKFQIEAELTDSISGEVLGAAVKQGFGEKLSDNTQALTLDNLKPLIDTWSTTMKATLVEILE